ncbi:cysteine-rich CPCC protein [Anaerobacterium chartisolvens]|uniref:Cysteine-rich CPCC protein n=1 Tax=Anaerobacterium chartisolvens TaxID=1297424 RepID=A0A369AQI6_9FIRM|nr:CPCC family cysteine-rich protein [Anaerobacterium chartisolvens]RCX11375.1 cysteine-rich CPCC protein [Anaerobacterium chartisolvens]
MEKYKCVCCGNRTLGSEPPGTFEICPVCYWEDDNVQFEDPDYPDGANNISLKEARENYKKIGAISEEFLEDVRKPSEDEIC